MNEFDDIIQKWNLTSLVVGVLDGGTSTTWASGVRSTETGEPATAATVYGIGSISKVFTATLAMTLVDRGMVELDTPIFTYYPSLPLTDPTARERLTLRHLLTHQGGFEGDGFAEDGTDEAADLSRFVAGFTRHSQFSQPGQRWSYSNNGFGLAGAIAAHVSGLSYEDAMRTYVFDPAGLSRSGFGQLPALPNTATGYDFGPDGEPAAKNAFDVARSSNPAGGLLSTVPDLLRFASYHLGTLADPPTGFLSDRTRRLMQEPQVRVSSMEAWGIGWGRKLEGGTTWVVEHGGWMNGFRAQLTLLPERAGAFAILTNSPLGHAAIEDLQELLLAEHFGLHKADLAALPGDSESLRRYAGRYVQSHMDVDFRIEGDELVLHLKTKWHDDGSDPLRCPLQKVAPAEFVITDGEFSGSRVTFDLEPEVGDPTVRVLHRVCFPSAATISLLE